MSDVKCRVCSGDTMIESFPQDSDNKHFKVKILCVVCQHGEEIIDESPDRVQRETGSDITTSS
jgi:hypothetical protein